MFLFCFLFCFLRATADERKQSPPSSVKSKTPNFSFGAQKYRWVSACICLLHSFSLDPLCVFSNWLGALQRSPPPPVVCFICDDHTSLTAHWDVKSYYSEAGWSIEVVFGWEDAPTCTAPSFPPQCQSWELDKQGAPTQSAGTVRWGLPFYEGVSSLSRLPASWPSTSNFAGEYWSCAGHRLTPISLMPLFCYPV